ncbi:unnamed protein product [Clonostachys rosea f. rosea IK726]|uniref:Uncharacterized protein n=1 Tax=Clonostachys rosea f. rosea IK726 TaxID=1349383 RepID=A0ACA9UCV6_BIOOC|nr:unnamed protein product [Clonostachys rosea f. rosea IK726]
MAEAVDVPHASLGATLQGVWPCPPVWQFRGFRCASIPRKFANPEPLPALTGIVVAQLLAPNAPERC